MKQLVIAVCIFMGMQSLWGQTKVGTIGYERKINVWKRIQDESRRAMMPEFRTTKHVLLFNDTASLYKTIQEEEEQPTGFGGEGGGGRMGRMMAGMDGDLFKNFSQGTSIQAVEQSGKNFLITDSIKKQPWKITAETKFILGYNCRKATMKQKGMGGFGFGGGMRNAGRQEDRQASTGADTARRARGQQEVEVVAWFAETITSPVGPDNFGQLPGAILQLDVDNGFISYTALDVKKEFAAKDFKEPKKGKRVTKEEFRAMMMEMMRNFGGGNMQPRD